MSGRLERRITRTPYAGFRLRPACFDGVHTVIRESHERGERVGVTGIVGPAHTYARLESMLAGEDIWLLKTPFHGRDTA